jgi:mRNA-degrading endonuclease RelE of RelBE toxin-antitoxin system
MFEITFTPEAVEDLRWFKKVDRKQILEKLDSQLSYGPAIETRNRKRLRPNKLAEWELRAGRYRVFFDIDQENELIKVVAVGYKRGSRLFIHGREYVL